MTTDFKDQDTITRILNQYRTIAVVGLSDKPDRPSYDVASYLQRMGYRIIPVNPSLKTVLGEKAYPDLTSIPEPVDVVDIFRRSEDIGPVVDEAIKIGAKAVWIQLGITNDQAALAARDAGLDVVMDRCIKIEHRNIYG